MFAQAKAHYLNVAKQMKSYEDIKYNEWRIKVENILPEILKTNLITKPTEREEITLRVINLQGDEIGNI